MIYLHKLKGLVLYFVAVFHGAGFEIGFASQSKWLCIRHAGVSEESPFALWKELQAKAFINLSNTPESHDGWIELNETWIHDLKDTICLTESITTITRNHQNFSAVLLHCWNRNCPNPRWLTVADIFPVLFLHLSYPNQTGPRTLRKVSSAS